MYEGGLEDTSTMQVSLQQRLDLALISQGFVTIFFALISLFRPQTLIEYGWDPLALRSEPLVTLKAYLFYFTPTILRSYLPSYRTEQEENLFILQCLGIFFLGIGIFSFYSVVSSHSRFRKLLIVILSFITYLILEIGIAVSLHEKLTWVNYLSTHPGPRTLLTALFVFHFVTLLSISSYYISVEYASSHPNTVQLIGSHHQQHHQRQIDHKIRHSKDVGSFVPTNSGGDRTIKFDEPQEEEDELNSSKATSTTTGQEPAESTEEWKTVSNKDRKIRRRM